LSIPNLESSQLVRYEGKVALAGYWNRNLSLCQLKNDIFLFLTCSPAFLIDWCRIEEDRRLVVAYLIDGYNLLHAMGVLRGRVGPQGLEKARLRLLGLLQGALGKDASQATIVFDAAAAPAGAAGEQDYQGIHVHFAVHHKQADDLIEALIRQNSAPRKLTVISDDRRIQAAARRRHCPVLGCLEFLEELERTRHRHHANAGPEPEKQPSSPQDMDRWLRAFADLDNEPEMKELFQPFNFQDEKDPGRH
jgi:predicted RNA-binding protein with PIN domain